MSRSSFSDYLSKHSVDQELALLLQLIAEASMAISGEVRTGALKDNFGLAGQTNVQGEDQKPLDILSNEIFERVCAKAPKLAALVSEEVDDVTWVKDPVAGDFILYFDPLDGSSNLDVNVTVGTIFSIARVQKDGDREVLLAGGRQICAGYAAYGPSTLLVVTLGEQVDEFTLDEEMGEFMLTAEQMRIPTQTSEYAINSARQRFWDAPVARYVADCLAGTDGPRGRDFNMRWIGSMVADVHRILTRGGVFLYPVDARTRDKGGRLRLMYEANPMSMIVEAAGGAAIHGTGRIMEIAPSELHQRVPVILGSAEEVATIEGYYKTT